MEDIISEIKSKIPGICLRTTLIAGFPGETEEDEI
jgi:ribosomal protein S12 methylthiotransferase